MYDNSRHGYVEQTIVIVWKGKFIGFPEDLKFRGLSKKKQKGGIKIFHKKGRFIKMGGSSKKGGVYLVLFLFDDYKNGT